MGNSMVRFVDSFRGEGERDQWGSGHFATLLFATTTFNLSQLFAT